MQCWAFWNVRCVGLFWIWASLALGRFGVLGLWGLGLAEMTTHVIGLHKGVGGRGRTSFKGM